MLTPIWYIFYISNCRQSLRVKRRLHKEPDTNTNEKKIKKVTEEFLRRDFKADNTLNDADRPVDANFKFSTRRFQAENPFNPYSANIFVLKMLSSFYAYCNLYSSAYHSDFRLLQRKQSDLGPYGF